MHDIQKEVAISLTNCCFKKKVLIFKLDESLYVDRAPTLWSKGHGFESSRGNKIYFLSLTRDVITSFIYTHAGSPGLPFRLLTHALSSYAHLLEQ